MRFLQYHVMVLSVLLGGAGMAFAQSTAKMFLPTDTAQWSTPSWQTGTGTGSVQRLDPSTLQLDADVATLGEYVENWSIAGALVDYYLKSPITIPKSANALRFWVRQTTKSYPYPSIRFLIRDSQGRVFTVSTLMVKDVSAEAGWCYGQTYRWNDSEMGRLEPWMVAPVDMKNFYQGPTGALQLVGIRCVLEAQGKTSLLLSGVTQIGEEGKPTNYWAIGGRFGWDGMMDKNVPYLLLNDLTLPRGTSYTVRWECLDARGWQVVASGESLVNPAGPTVLLQDEPHVEFPMLPKGNYLLRIVALGENGSSKTLEFPYYCIRTGISTKPQVIGGKLITFATSNDSNVFTKAAAASLSITCTKDVPLGTTLKYTVSTQDKQQLATVNTTWTGTPVTIALTPYLQQHATVRVTVEAKQGDQLLDSSYRVFGVASPIATAQKVYPEKKRFFEDKIVRNKADWNEGGTPVNSDFANVSKNFATWVTEGKAIGYNAVELSAPWAELEVLPGVYDFSYLDQLVKQATDQGFEVLLRVHPLAGNTPMWCYADFQQNQFGYAHGLWGGGSNLIFGPASDTYNTGLQAFLRQLSAHYAGNPKMMGYTFTSLFFDHGYLDQPWYNQYVDYSDAARTHYIDYLRRVKHYSLASLNHTYGTNYVNWDAVEMPKPRLTKDADGQLIPRNDPAWQDFISAKLDAIHRYRMGTLDAVRKGDPYCQVGLYSDTEFRLFYGDEVAQKSGFIPQGSMEEQFPPSPYPYRVRYEPIGKVARTKELVDVGMSNMLFYQPGRDAMHNYWFPQWTMQNVTPDIREAELRLKSWFAVCDKLIGAKPLAGAKTAKPILIYSLDTLTTEWQHLFYGRVEDYRRPISYEISKQQVDVNIASNQVLTDEGLKHTPYVLLPYNADLLRAAQRQAIVRYVQHGGTLVMEACGGRYDIKNALLKDALLRDLHLPTVAAVMPESTQTDLPATVKATGSPLSGVSDILFRVKEWDPPIGGQPSPWIQNINKSYLRAYRPTPGDYQVLATFGGNSPAVTLHSVGTGKVLVFWGVVDWFATETLLPKIDQWANAATAGEKQSDPDLLANFYVKGTEFYALGRRFVEHDLVTNIDKIKQLGPKNIVVKFPAILAGSYRIHDILNDKEYPAMDAKALQSQGVTLSLYKGDAFVLQLTPQ